MLESLSTGADEAGTESTSLATKEGKFFGFLSKTLQGLQSLLHKEPPNIHPHLQELYTSQYNHHLYYRGDICLGINSNKAFLFFEGGSAPLLFSA